MSGNSTWAGQSICPPPFLDADLFPQTDVFLAGRFCSILSGTSCCLPCPHAQWLYPINFESMIERASWINVPGLLCSIFLIASFIALPVAKTHRHYLSVCLVTSVAMMNVAFLIPIGANPTQCSDTITPNSMKTSTTCAVSGALVIAGGWFGVMWVYLITLALHLQICWEFVVGKLFMRTAIIAGCVIPIFGLVVALSLSGVSFRFGKTCHVNAANSLISLWIPLLLLSSLTLFMQLATFIYCLRVYFASLGEYSATTLSSGSRSLNANHNKLTPKQAYHRIRRVIELQWRAILIVLVIVSDVIFFAVVFVSIDQVESELVKGEDRIIPWLNCLIETSGDKEVCSLNTNNPRVSEGAVLSVLVLLSLNGFWCLLLLGRYSMLTGWWDLITGRLQDELEFTCADEHKVYKVPTDYEMLANTSDHGSHPDPTISPLPKATLTCSYGQSIVWNSVITQAMTTKNTTAELNNCQVENEYPV